MKAQEKLNRVQYFILQNPVGLYLMALLIPLNPKLLSYGIALILLETLIRRKNVSIQNFKVNLNFKNPGIWLVVFYLFHLLGLFYSENMKFGTMDIGMKASLVIFPLLFLFYKPEIYWKLWIKFFVFGAILSIIYNLYFSFAAYQTTARFDEFLGVRLSHLMHRGYWATYLTIALFFVLKMMMQTKSLRKLTELVLIAMLFAVLIVISESRMGLIILFILIVWGVFQILRKMSKKNSILVLTLVIVSGIVMVFSVSNSRLSDRLSETLDAVSISFEDLDKESEESTTLRLFTWYSSAQLIKENFWFGVGTGDIKDKLNKRNEDNGFVQAAQQELNSHNQFFNSHIALGLFGPLSLLMVFITSCLKTKGKEGITSWIRGVIFILFLSFLTESFLEVQAGIIPFAFMLCLFYSMELKSVFTDSETLET